MSDPIETPVQPAPPPPPPPAAAAPAPAPHPSSAPSVTDDPGFMLGVVSLATSYFVSIVGLVVGIIALQQSRRAGFQNPTAIAGIIVSGAVLVITVITVIASFLFTAVWLVFVLVMVQATGAAPTY